MKHLKLFFALFAMLALGVGNAWGALTEEYSYTFTAKQFSNNSTAKTLGSVTWTPATTWSSGSGYWGYDGTKGQQWGSSSNTLNKMILTSGTSFSNVKKIEINASIASDGGCKLSVKVGNTTIGTTKTLTKTATAYTFEDANGLTGAVEITLSNGSKKKAQYIKSIKIYTESSAPEKVLSSIEISGDLTKKTYEEGDELDLAGVTVNAIYDDASTKVVTNDVEWSYTPNPLTQGTTSVDITASYEEKTVTKTITGLTVNEHIVTPDEYCIVPNNAFWGTSYNGSDANAATTLSGTQNDISILHTKSGSNLYVNNTQTRVYTNHAMQISVPLGYVITSIAFTADGSNWAGTHTANVGTMTDSKNWAGIANEVTITFGGTCRITKICVNYIKDAKYVLTITEPAVGTGTLVVKDGANVLTSGAEIYEGTELTVTATPATGYEGGTIVVKDGSDNDITSTVYADGVLTMPAYNVTISAAFEQKQCTILGTPSVSASTTYNTATLSWETVANAAKYSVKVGAADAFETTETSYKATDLEAETIYTYQVKAIAADDQSEYCDSEAAEGSFTTSAAPVVTLTLKDIAGTTTKTGALNSTITLPDEAATCTKTFVGWDVDENCDHAPTYAPGAEYTLAAETQTLYAVYADAVGGEPTWNRVTNLAALTSGGTFILGYEATPKSGKIIPMRTSGTATTSAAGYMYSGNADGTTSNNATLDMASISESSKFEIVLEASSIVDGAVNIKLGDNYLGNTNTKNNCKLFTSASKNTAFTPTIGTNDVVKLTIKANNDYTTLQFNNNSGSYRYAVYGGAQKDVVFYKKEITLSYSNYSTTCAAAPIVTVDPTSVTATVAGGNGKVEVTYENVNTANVAVALYNDEACTEKFTAGWLTADLDGDKNITYTVAENTTYAERKAYIQLTAPETTGATDPDVVVIPVTQAAKDKVFASLEELVAADLTAGDEVTVTLNNDVIKEFYIYSSKRCGVVFDVQKDGKDIKIYFNSQTTIDDWAVGGKLSGTLTNVKWTTYSSAWQLAPANTWAWANLTYTEPKAVSTVVVSGAPTKTTYVDGEAFDPAGLTVTVNYNDATTEVNPTGVTFTVTPTTLVKGQTSVSVTATFNSVTSAAYEVTSLTVNDIPTKTVAEFIAAGGTRCYLEGIVSGLTEGNSMKYGNFDLTDASGTIYVYGCLSAAGESQKFAALGVKNGDKIKDIADEYELYGGTKDEAKNVQYVSHISAASITIANITMEVGETKTIAATVVPAEAEVTYTIKENAVNAISLSSNTITALAEGTATITATVAEGATYLGNSVDFTVTVGPKTESEEVVILAEHNGQWYALKAETGSSTNSLAALEVEYFNGVLYNVDEADKASITWKRTIVGNFETFQYGDKYLKGSSSTNLFMEDGTEGKYQWDKDTHTMLIGSTNRTFLYQGTYFKNYAISNAGRTVDGTTYSALPVVTAAKFEDATIIIRDDLKAGNYGTICYENKITNFAGVTFYAVAGREGRKVIFDEVTELEAGMPYLFRAEATKLKMALGNEKATSAGKHNSLQGTFIQIDPAEENILTGNYVMYNNMIKKCGKNCGLNANRAYFIGSELESLGAPAPQAPGRKRVSMDVLGENEATGVDNITENGVIAPAMQGTYDIMGRQLSEPTATGFYIVNGKKVFVVK